MLSCTNLTLKNNDGYVFKDVNFTLLPTSLAVVRGGNGSGKTSLLKVIIGLISQTKGEVFWNNININEDLNAFRQNVTYIGHGVALKPELTVMENLNFWCKIYKGEELLNAALQYFNLTNILDVPVSALSAGWQRRVDLVRLLLAKANLWLLDEPEINLDQEAKELLTNLVQVRIRDGGVVVIASHNFDDLTNANYINIEDFCHA